MRLLTTLILAALLCATAGAEDAPPATGSQLRALLGRQIGQWRFTVAMPHDAGSGFRGEWSRPRWPLDLMRLQDERGHLIHERYTHRGAGGAPGRTTIVARDGELDPWKVVEAGTRAPARLDLPRVLLEALVVAAFTAQQAGEVPRSSTLEIEPFLAERIVDCILAPADRSSFAVKTARAEVERGEGTDWSIRCHLSGSKSGKPCDIQITLAIDGDDGILPRELAAEAATLLQVRMPRPGVFKSVPRVVDHFVALDQPLETQFWLWFSDREGGLGAKGALFDYQITSAVWRDQNGVELPAEPSGPTPDHPQGARLFFVLRDLEKKGVTRLDLELDLSINLFPVRVTVSYSRGGDVRENERAWMTRQLPETVIGELPGGVQELPRR